MIWIPKPASLGAVGARKRAVTDRTPPDGSGRLRISSSNFWHLDGLFSHSVFSGRLGWTVRAAESRTSAIYALHRALRTTGVKTSCRTGTDCPAERGRPLIILEPEFKAVRPRHSNLESGHGCSSTIDSAITPFPDELEGYSVAQSRVYPACVITAVLLTPVGESLMARFSRF